jgi:hypothetical protein
MSNPLISTRPLSDHEKVMREKFYESIAAQSFKPARPRAYLSWHAILRGPNTSIFR